MFVSPAVTTFRTTFWPARAWPATASSNTANPTIPYRSHRMVDLPSLRWPGRVGTPGPSAPRLDFKETAWIWEAVIWARSVVTLPLTAPYRPTAAWAGRGLYASPETAVNRRYPTESPREGRSDLAAPDGADRAVYPRTEELPSANDDWRFPVLSCPARLAARPRTEEIMLDFLVQGNLVLPDGVLRAGPSGVPGGRVAGIYAARARFAGGGGDRDARGCLVYPGMVDAHVHCRKHGAESGAGHPGRGGRRRDHHRGDALRTRAPGSTGPTRSARKWGRSPRHAGWTWRCWPPARSARRPRRWRRLVREGACGFKLSLYETHPDRFPRIDDDVLWQLLPEIARHGVPVGFHAENDRIIEDLIARARQEGRTSPLAHPETRPPASETLAVLKLLELAYWTKVKLHIFHASPAPLPWSW